MFPYVFKEIMGTSDTILINGKKKLEFDKVWTSSNMVLNIHANWAQFTVCSAYKPHLLNTITSVLERHNIEVIAANVSFNHNEDGKTCMILVHVSFKLDPPPCLLHTYMHAKNFAFLVEYLGDNDRPTKKKMKYFNTYTCSANVNMV